MQLICLITEVIQDEMFSLSCAVYTLILVQYRGVANGGRGSKFDSPLGPHLRGAAKGVPENNFAMKKTVDKAVYFDYYFHYFRGP